MPPGSSGRSPVRKAWWVLALAVIAIALVAAGLLAVGRGYAVLKLTQTASEPVVSRQAQGWAESSPRILVVGDSRVARWRTDLTVRGLPLAVSGVGGETSGQLLARWQTTPPPAQGTTVLILTGVNDLVAADLNPQRSDRIERALLDNVAALAAQMRRQGLVPVIGAVGQAALIDWRRRLFGWSDELYALIDRSNTGLRELATIHGYAWFDTNAAIATSEGRVPPAFALDTLHWTEPAYRALEAALAQTVAAQEAKPA